jgi:hypothetical protein
MAECSDHYRITAAGWDYRTNNRGWVIYQDPQTRLWQTHSEAISIIIHAQDSDSGRSAPPARDSNYRP